MSEINSEILASYLDDALDTAETAMVEQALRDSETLRHELRKILQERDRGEHSIGAIWRRYRLTCPSREQLGSFLLEALEPDLQDYVDFHLRVIGCSFCQANLADLRDLHNAGTPEVQARRQRIFQSSAGFFRK